MAGLLESLDAEETLERRRHWHWHDRLMMLADGVFAVALTFLAGVVPVVLLLVFVVGWRMRRWILRRLGGTPFVG